MRIITLTTDRRSDDFFLGRVKGELAKICPTARVIDLAHNLPAFDISYAAFILKQSWRNFPEGTIHLIGVDSEEGPHQKHLIIRAHNQYFICADTGIISLIFSDSEISEIYQPFSSYLAEQPALIRFILLAGDIITKDDFSIFSEPSGKIKKKLSTGPMYEESLILGKIIYTDSYNNAVCNITKELFEEVGRKRPFIIYAGSLKNKIAKISKRHIDVAHGEILALFNSMGLLELSINKGRIMHFLNLKLYNEIRILFYDNKNS